MRYVDSDADDLASLPFPWEGAGLPSLDKSDRPTCGIDPPCTRKGKSFSNLRAPVLGFSRGYNAKCLSRLFPRLWEATSCLCAVHNSSILEHCICNSGIRGRSGDQPDIQRSSPRSYSGPTDPDSHKPLETCQRQLGGHSFGFLVMGSRYWI